MKPFESGAKPQRNGEKSSGFKINQRWGKGNPIRKGSEMSVYEGMVDNLTGKTRIPLMGETAPKTVFSLISTRSHRGTLVGSLVTFTPIKAIRKAVRVDP